jgi:predicted RNA methylase
VIGVEIDDKVIEIARKNCEELEIENMDFIQADVTTLQLNTKNTSEKGKEGGELLSSVDTVIMNPPFGTRNKGIDIKFLQKAMEVCLLLLFIIIFFFTANEDGLNDSNEFSTSEHMLLVIKLQY